MGRRPQPQEVIASSLGPRRHAFKAVAQCLEHHDLCRCQCGIAARQRGAGIGARGFGGDGDRHRVTRRRFGGGIVVRCLYAAPDPAVQGDFMAGVEAQPDEVAAERRRPGWRPGPR